MGDFTRGTAAFLIAALAAPAWSFAQQSGPSPAEQPAPTITGAPADLPVSLDRIRRGLTTQTRSARTKDGLKIEYYVQVYGQAPRIELFAPTENLTTAPVRYGGMTHQEFLQVVTPEEFRAPAADISGAIAALIRQYSKKRQDGKARR